MEYLWVFLWVVLYFDEPVGRVEIQTMNKYPKQYQTPKCLISYLLSNCFFPAKCFCSFLIRQEKQSRYRSIVCTANLWNRFFFKYKITNCTISQDICTLSTHYLFSVLCSWKIRYDKNSEDNLQKNIVYFYIIMCEHQSLILMFNL